MTCHVHVLWATRTRMIFPQHRWFSDFHQDSKLQRKKLQHVAFLVCIIASTLQLPISDCYMINCYWFYLPKSSQDKIYQWTLFQLPKEVWYDSVCIWLSCKHLGMIVVGWRWCCLVTRCTKPQLWKLFSSCQKKVVDFSVTLVAMKCSGDSIAMTGGEKPSSGSVKMNPCENDPPTERRQRQRTLRLCNNKCAIFTLFIFFLCKFCLISTFDVVHSGNL